MDATFIRACKLSSMVMITKGNIKITHKTKELTQDHHTLLYGGAADLVAKRLPGNQEVGGSNPTAVHMDKNESWTLGKLPAQNVPQIASRTRV